MSRAPLGGSPTHEGDLQSSRRILVIEPTRGWRRLGIRELVEYRDLFLFLVLRSLKARYAQTVLGVAWAFLQPLAQMVVFSIVFGYFVAVDSEGIPYPLFALTALIPWTLFSNSVIDATESLVAQAQLVSKVYFPRLLLPLTAVAGRLVDFTISLLLLAALQAWYGIVPTAGCAFIPLLVAILMVFAAGMGMWLSALAIQYRDVRHAMTFGIQLFMYAAPIVYPITVVPERWHPVYAANPLVGVVEGFRSALLGTRPPPVHWIAEGAAIAVVVFISGLFFFRQKERVFADVA